MSESDEYPKFVVVYDSYLRTYSVYGRHHQGNTQTACCFGTRKFKWSAIRYAKELIRNSKERKERTLTEVWGPCP